MRNYEYKVEELDLETIKRDIYKLDLNINKWAVREYKRFLLNLMAPENILYLGYYLKERHSKTIVLSSGKTYNKIPYINMAERHKLKEATSYMVFHTPVVLTHEDILGNAELYGEYLNTAIDFIYNNESFFRKYLDMLNKKINNYSECCYSISEHNIRTIKYILLDRLSKEPDKYPDLYLELMI